MSENKTKQTEASVESFLASATDAQTLTDCHKLIKIMSDVTGEPPKMWGPSIVGFGTYRYKYASGREGDMPLTGFSPRKQNLTIYINTGFKDHDNLLGKLGKFKTSKACLYVKHLDDIDTAVLRELVKRSVHKLLTEGFNY